MSRPPLPVDEARDAWLALRAHTPARIALGRSGASLRTAAVLELGLAHARARDAVHQALDVPRLRAELQAQFPGPVLVVRSGAADRAAYLARPDWGRRLDPASHTALEASASDSPGEVLFVLGDGLSAAALQAHALPLLRALRPQLGARSLAPWVIATQARVALGDEIGEILRARLVVLLIGERPGLSSPDSLGVYLTWDPRRGRNDAERECLSNIHAAGLGYAEAAQQLAARIDTAFAQARTGVAALSSSGPAALPPADTAAA